MLPCVWRDVSGKGLLPVLAPVRLRRIGASLCQPFAVSDHRDFEAQPSAADRACLPPQCTQARVNSRTLIAPSQAKHPTNSNWLGVWPGWGQLVGYSDGYESGPDW